MFALLKAQLNGATWFDLDFFRPRMSLIISIETVQGLDLMLSSSQTLQETAKGWVAYALSGSLVKRNSLIALFVGCILSVINQYDALARHILTSKLALQLILNFMIPFTVSTVSALVNRGWQNVSLNKTDRDLF